MNDLEPLRDWLLGFLITAVVGLLALVRRLDVGEIHRRLGRLEDEVFRHKEDHEP